jgi:hypothetical protein
MTIAEQLNNLYQIKEDIKNTMIDSGIDMTNIPFSEYATIISEASKLDINKTKFGVSLLSFINPDAINLFDFVGTGIQDIKTFALQGTFTGNSKVQTAVFPDLTTISGVAGCKHTFAYCNTLTAFSMPNLTTLSGGSCCWNMFINCTQLTTADLSAITEVSGDHACYGMFAHCYALNTIRFDNLSTVSGDFAFEDTFYRCSSLTTISFPKLTTISNTNAFREDTFFGCTALTEIHFRYDMKEIVEGLDGYSSKFGATNATIYFDLGDKVDITIEPTPDNATVTFYQGNGIIPNPKTEVPLYGWVAENTTYYTKTATPTAGDLIYNADGNPTGQVITAVENNIITIE